MANYHDFSVLEVTDPAEIGSGSGETPEGEFRYCIALSGKPVNLDLGPGWHEINWMSLTPACAVELYSLLCFVLGASPDLSVTESPARQAARNARIDGIGSE